MVQLLLSTYRPPVYFSTQLDSLKKQTYHDIKLTVRDDGSGEPFVTVVRDELSRFPSAGFLSGEHIGVVDSYFTLLKEAKVDTYYAFCDQDDVWHEDKIERAVMALSSVESSIPALYFSRLEYVNDNQQEIGFSPLPLRQISFENALVENLASGCAMVMNRAARDLVTQALPDVCIMHDWWCFLVVSAFGQILYDKQPGIKYRLHAHNVVGAPTKLSQDLRRRTRRFLMQYSHGNWVHAQAREFQKCFGAQLPTDKRKLLWRFVQSRRSIFGRISYMLSPDVYRQRKLDNLLFRLLIVLNRY